MNHHYLGGPIRFFSFGRNAPSGSERPHANRYFDESRYLSSEWLSGAYVVGLDGRRYGRPGQDDRQVDVEQLIETRRPDF